MIAVGIDTHKASLAVCVVDGLGRKLGETTVANDAAGHLHLERFLRSLPTDRCVGIEGSGGHGAALAERLQAGGERIVEVPARLTARQRRHARQLGKSDPADALAIARVVAGEERLPAAACNRRAAEMKLLCDYRAQLLGERTRLSNRLHADLEVLAPGYHMQLPDFDSVRRRSKVEALLTMVGGLRAELARCRLTRISQLSDELAEIERRLGGLVAGSGSRLTELCGIGTLTAARLLAETGDVRRFRSADAFAMAAGVAPIPASSGKTQRHRLNRGGNRQLNCTLYTMAFVQGRCDERARAYLARKQAEGKSWKEAMRCLKRHLARVVYRQMLADAVELQLTT